MSPYHRIIINITCNGRIIKCCKILYIWAGKRAKCIDSIKFICVPPRRITPNPHDDPQQSFVYTNYVCVCVDASYLIVDIMANHRRSKLIQILVIISIWNTNINVYMQYKQQENMSQKMIVVFSHNGHACMPACLSACFDNVIFDLGLIIYNMHVWI